jgi:hypothetical protein
MIFSPDWLALRETADTRARSTRLTERVAQAVAGISPLRVVDLATGTGANVRYLSGRLCLDPAGTVDPVNQDWLLVDHDPALLPHLAELANPATPRLRVEIRQANLQTLDPGLFEGRTLVTASALLDLVSEQWLHTLATQCRAARAIVLFVLTYDGRVECSPEEEGDDLVRELVNRHQRTDKGFGPAAGPAAAAIAARSFEEVGYHVEREPSDWTLNPDDRELQRQLVAGWGTAAAAMAPERLEEITRWMKRRVAHVDAGRSHMRVGHEDLAACL